MGYKLLCTVLGFFGGVLAAALVFLLFVTVTYALGFDPASARRSPLFQIAMAGLQGGVIFLPIGGAVQGWRYASQQQPLREFMIGKKGVSSEGGNRNLRSPLTTLTATRRNRALIAWAAIWTAIIAVAFLFFDPFQRYYYSRWCSGDVFRFLALWLGPIVCGWLVVRLSKWVAKGTSD